jgi:hypothetical protein
MNKKEKVGHPFLLVFPNKETYLKLKEIGKNNDPKTTVGGLINSIIKEYLSK